MTKLKEATAVRNQRLYDGDFCAWLAETADAIRARDFEAIAWEALAEEVDSLGRSERQALDSLIIRVIEHLLKLAYSPAEGPRRDWADSVAAHRMQVRRLLATSPSLRGKIDLADLYADARRLAARSLASHDGIPAGVLPLASPFSLAEILDDDWMPARSASD